MIGIAFCIYALFINYSYIALSDIGTHKNFSCKPLRQTLSYIAMA